MSEGIDDVWQKLKPFVVKEEGFLRLRVAGDAVWGLYAALEKPDDRPALLLEVPTKALSNAMKYPTSEGFQLTPRTLAAGPSGRVRLELRLAGERFEGPFSAFTSNIMSVLKDASSANDAVKRLLDQVARWQQFLARHGPSGLTPRAQHGLYGELTALRRLAKLSSTGQALSWWTGPGGTPQDFECGQLALEVKTSRVASHQVMTISSINQLEPPDDLELFVLFFWLDVRRGEGGTLPELIASLRELVAVAPVQSQAVFEDCLEKVGYLDVHAGAYSQTSYTVRKQSLYEVRDGFPRIRTESLSPGVGGVSYSVQVSQCESFRAEPDRLRELIEEMRT